MTGSTLRVSVAALCRVLVEGSAVIPQAAPLLALERKATCSMEGKQAFVTVLAQPFGGALRILDEAAVARAAGGPEYDSDEAREQHDFRIRIHPARWPDVKALCLDELAKFESRILDLSPRRELAEEFCDTLRMHVPADAYTLRKVGLVVEDTPSPSHNIHARGEPTVRVYAVYEAVITSAELRAALIESSARYADQELQARALADLSAGGKGRANAALVLPLDQVQQAFHEQPAGVVRVSGHELHRSTGAVLGRDTL